MVGINQPEIAHILYGKMNDQNILLLGIKCVQNTIQNRVLFIQCSVIRVYVSLTRKVVDS